MLAVNLVTATESKGLGQHCPTEIYVILNVLVVILKSKSIAVINNELSRGLSNWGFQTQVPPMPS